MRKFYLVTIVSFFLYMATVSQAQTINTDSLVNVMAQKINKDQQWDEAIRIGHIGVKAAPDYLDFHLLLGRAHQFQQQLDSARYYYQYVLQRNTAYKEAYLFLSEVEKARGDWQEAEKVLQDGILIHPDYKVLYERKIRLIREFQGVKAAYSYIKSVIEIYPKEASFRQQYLLLSTQIDNDRYGAAYSYTTLDRENVGPWHLISGQYIRERDWGSLIGRINYANRLSSGFTIADGMQYEAESYFFTGKKSYSYVGAAYSDAVVFPKWRLGYSFFHNFEKGWEGDTGIRYNHFSTTNVVAGVTGVGKYLGPYWVNLRAFWQWQESRMYPAFTLTTRYYLGGRFDFFGLTAGYGTSPDERTVLGLLDQRSTLDSYRIGVGYHRTIADRFLCFAQLNYNYQEYMEGEYQNEYEFNIGVQYRILK